MRLLQKIKEYLKANPKSEWSFRVSRIYNILGHNEICGGDNKLILGNSYLKNCKIIVKGTNNVIDLGQSANYLSNCSIHIIGNDNVIRLGERNVFFNADLYIEDNNGKIEFGNRNRILGFTHVAALEGESIVFGDGCLFSTDVVFRNSDSHAILNAESGERINPAKSIRIGNRVWFGNKTIILKGITIGDDVIVGTGSVVTSDISAKSIAVGVPAKVVKTNVKWRLQRTLTQT